MTTSTTAKATAREYLYSFLVAALTGIAANLVVFFVTTRGLGLSPTLVEPESGEHTTMSIGSVIGATIAPALAGTIFLALLVRYSKRPFLWFHATAGVFLLLSMIPVVLAPVDTPSTRVVMAVMHIVAAVAIVGALTVRTRAALAAQGPSGARE